MESIILKVPTKNALYKYSNAINRCKAGEIAFIEDIEEYVMFNGKDWLPMPKATMENNEGLSLSLYDLNKMIILQLPIATEEKMNEFKRLLSLFEEQTQAQYYMLLCKDISYYTIFTAQSMPDFDSFGEAVVNCIADLGDIVSIDPVPDSESIEIWVKNNEEAYCMYLFNCDRLVVSYGV